MRFCISHRAGGAYLADVQLAGADLWLKYDVLAFLEAGHLPFARILVAPEASAQFSHA